MYEIMIIGAGPAGLSAAIYVARKRLAGVLISADIGGQVNWNAGVENYLGYQFIEGSELIARFTEQVNKFPLEQKIGERVNNAARIKDGFEVILESGNRLQGKTVILATGKRPKKLNVPGEEEFRGRGVTYCAICDGPVFAGQRVAVVGGGNAAFEAALDMVKIAEHIDLVSPAELSGDATLIAKLRNSRNVTIHTGLSVQEIRGANLVTGILTKDTAGKARELPVGGVFIEVGLEPSSDIVSGFVNLNKKGEIPVSCACETTEPGLFAAGDVTDVSGKQIIIAAGEGAKAALSAHRYLQHLGSKG